jgi:MFS family permease
MIPIMTFFFGLLGMCQGFVTSLGGLVACRLLLGISEAPVSSSDLCSGDDLTLNRCCLASFSPSADGIAKSVQLRLPRRGRGSASQDEIATRLAFILLSAPLAGGFGGLLAAAILNISSIGYLTRWRMIFFIEGLATMVLAIIFYFFLTSGIDSARWLTEEEKLIANARLKAENPATTVVIERASWQNFKRGTTSPPWPRRCLRSEQVSPTPMHGAAPCSSSLARSRARASSVSSALSMAAQCRNDVLLPADDRARSFPDEYAHSRVFVVVLIHAQRPPSSSNCSYA